jgi:hypothetical protein
MADKLFRDYFNEKVTDTVLPVNAKVLIQDGTGEPTQINASSISTGQLVKVTENGKTGYRLKDADPANYGNIGDDAVDLSVTTFPSVNGATGDNSYASGVNTLATGSASNSSGESTTASGDGSNASGFNTLASGDYSNAQGFNTSAISEASNAIGVNTLASGVTSNSQGSNNFARSLAEHSGGVNGTDYTPQSVTGFNLIDRLVNYGNGVDTSNRSDAYTLFKNGMQKFFTAALSTITNAVKGSVMLDENARMNIHDGTDFKEVAFIDDVNLKVDKVTGSSLITDASITRLANTSGTNTGDVNETLGTVTGRGATTATPIILTSLLTVKDQKIDSDFITNLFIGRNAGNSNTPLSTTQGQQNTFIGSQSGIKNTTGYAVLNVGFASGYENTVGNGNCNVGYQSGYSNETGSFNTNLGTDAGARNKGDNNMFLGWHSGFGFSSFLTGDNNNILGYETGGNMLSAFGNNGLGRRVFFNLTNGYNNVSMGDLSSFNLQTGISNVTIGRDSGFSMVTSVSNVIVGQRAGYKLTSNFNTFLGNLSGFEVTTGSSNVFVGSNTGSSGSQKVDVINSIAIGSGTFTTKDNQAILGSATITETILRGNVGINQPTPTERLDVVGNGKFSGTLSCGQFTTATEPAYVKGSQFFNTTLDKMRIGGATAYETVTSS